MPSVNPGGIASTAGFGVVRLVGFPVSPPGITATTAFGQPFILRQSARALSFFIRGVDVSDYVANPSLEGSNQLGSRSSVSFRVIPYMVGSVVQSTFIPALFDEVIVHHNASGARLFGGEVESIARNVPPGTSGFFELQLTCTDFGIMCERRMVAKLYQHEMAYYIHVVALDLVQRFLAGTGITYDGHLIAPSFIGDEILFNWISVAEAFRQMADATGTDWYIDPYKALRLVSRTGGTAPAAPFAIEQNDGNWVSLVSNTSRSRFANRVIVRNSQDVAALWTDSHTADGSRGYDTTYPMDVAPVVLLDGVEQIVCALSEVAQTPGWQWYYQPGLWGVSANQADVPSSGAIEIIYPSRVSSVAIAEDAASIAALTAFEHVEEVKDLPDGSTLEQYAAGVLARAKELGTDVTVITDRPGLAPGQALTVNANGVSGTFVIDSVSFTEYSHNRLRWTVRASNTSQRRGSGARFFSKLMSSSRQPVDRVDSNIAFVLAETVEGFTNPGLTIGAKEAVRVARKNGWLKMCRLFFKSVETTPTSATVEVDILQNGVSIFGSTKMVFPAAATAVQSKFYFRENPLRVSAGDVFTIEVLAADAAAKDGWIELQVQG